MMRYNRKALLATSVSLVMVGVSFVSQASESAVLAVQGTFNAGSCNPTLTDGGVINFDEINTHQLSTTGDTSLSASDVSLDISCDGLTKVGFNVIDNQEGSEISSGSGASNSDASFGLGYLPDGTTAVGYYQISPGAVKVDGDVYNLYASNDNGNSWSTAQIVTSDSSIFTASNNGNEPVMGTFFNYMFHVHTFIDNKDNRLTSAITDNAAFSGSATFDIVYL